MKKIYQEPIIRKFELDVEQMIAASQVSNGGTINLYEETVDTQLSNHMNLWGNEGFWK